MQAASPDQLRELLTVASGGVVFTAIQKFLPPDAGSRRREAQTGSGLGASGGQSLVTSAATKGPLSERRNIIVIADEVHRSQYDLMTTVIAAERSASLFASRLPWRNMSIFSDNSP